MSHYRHGNPEGSGGQRGGVRALQRVLHLEVSPDVDPGLAAREIPISVELVGVNPLQRQWKAAPNAVYDPLYAFLYQLLDLRVYYLPELLLH